MIEPFPTHIQRLILTNHKCFYEPTEFEFGPGFNILVGENSSGKSTVLEALDLSTTPQPHHSTLNESSLGTRKDEPSTIETRFAIIPAALAELSQSKEIYVCDTLADGQKINWTRDIWASEIPLDRYFSFDVRRTASANEVSRLGLSRLDCKWYDALNGGQVTCAVANFPEMQINGSMSGGYPQLWGRIRTLLQIRTYRLLTERRITPTSGFASPDLASDGSNLAFCLNHLKSHNGSLHRDLNRLTRHILPAIKSVNAVPENNQFTIKINHVDDDENRGDLAVGLSQVGTGVGNVIAMLYVVLTAQHPRTILLEEPNSYLHPRALRELLAILADNAIKHQYFITTHSSDVLRSVQATTVTQLEYDGTTSSRKQVKGDRVGDLKAGLMNMGIRLSDLHGCDCVIWVEGQTEEAVFPILIRKYLGAYASSTAVLRVHATSDFDGDGEINRFNPMKVAAIYEKLSTGNALAPMMAGIILDRESRQKTQCDKIASESNGRIHFLDRPMLEDYFLHGGAIAELIHERTGKVVTAEAVAASLEAAKQQSNLWLKPKAKTSERHAARTLNYVCGELTNQAMEYSKTRDAPFLVEHLLKVESNTLSDLKALLMKVLAPDAVSPLKAQ